MFIGICLYEFLCGMVPFGEEAEDPYEIHDEIMNMPIKYPKFLTDIKAKRLMDQLLNKVAEVRLGGSFAALKAHPWFDNFDWVILEPDCESNCILYSRINSLIVNSSHQFFLLRRK